ncbi:G-type lectin S-receptor-like serine/threonine-protein kinase At2g19130 [Oryza brachyantha]|uniref:G-type lectin S-receptor-like serine/threonine-protein kinase At2g19130 n=1 Tax=Oryza brachyantha TaxID=4533 RepID=UPI001ADB5488|nr:G-type lectin S-receptor-like serine/threonine-protein kinase At2g19130 [Oryza brachyantha]
MASAVQVQLLVTAVLCISPRCFASDTISATSPVSGSRTVVSKGGSFEVGFFRPPVANSNATSSSSSSRSSNYYVGIWYKKAVSPCTPVWIANRAAPVADPASSRFVVAADGNLVLINEANALVWSTNVSSGAGGANGTVAVILDTGNLVLRRKVDGDDEVVLWQSMDHPADTWLPGGRLGLNKVTGEAQVLTAWKNSGDPAPGVFSLGIDPAGTSQYFILWNRTVPYWASGEWNGDIFAGIPEMTSHYIYNFEFVSDANASYFTYSLQDPAIISRLVVSVSGQITQLTWVPSADEWILLWTEPHRLCDVHAVCGAFAVCDEKSQPFCSCLSGFRAAAPDEWDLGDHTKGCHRNTPLRCASTSTNTSAATGDEDDDDDDFLLIAGVSPPKNPSRVKASSDPDCRSACLMDCSCNAYSYGDGCALWHGDLLNLQRRTDEAAGSGNLYVRLSAMDVASKSSKKTVALACASSAAALILALSTMAVVLLWMSRKRQSLRFTQALERGNLVAFRFSDVRTATKNFSEKLGGGSFGSVYKGKLPGGVSIAVKKLEGLASDMGDKQFRNEVRTIGTIHHVNLVRLRGFCSGRGGERLLVYDYMPHGSLDRALFGGKSPGAAVLSWGERYQIALGAARGLLYLHQGCRDRIIHCDIKPENILLDEALVAKVADFGLAKLVGRDFSRVLTTVRGTIGYLAPEWISGVPITAKADVYSFGMVLLEIVSGRRNARWSGPCSEYFPLAAARSVREGEVAGLLDERLDGEADLRELDRACRVACWCVQDEEANRPAMEQVVQALEGVISFDVPPVPVSLKVFADGASLSSFSDECSGAQLKSSS